MLENFAEGARADDGRPSGSYRISGDKEKNKMIMFPGLLCNIGTGSPAGVLIPLLIFSALMLLFFLRKRRALTALTVLLLLAGTVPAPAADEPTEIRDWTGLFKAFANGGNYKLSDDFDTTYTQNKNLIVTNKVTLNLNGHTIDRGLRNPENNGYVITVSGESQLTLTGTGTITGGCNTGFGGGVYVDKDGTFTMGEGITITGNTAEYGGGVFADGTFNMNGGVISGNKSTRSIGGVYVFSNGTFNMYGGKITGNTADEAGGGVGNMNSFNLSGGEISGNVKGGTWDNDKKVYSGGDPSNVLLRTGKKITVTGELDPSVPIGISMTPPDVFTEGLNVKEGVFTSDDPGYYVEIVTVGETKVAKLTKKSDESAATPQITPEGGEYPGSVTVTIECETDGASIYYTTDGTNPTGNSTLYDGEFTISGSGDHTVKAIAVRNDLLDSQTAQQAYTIKAADYTLEVNPTTFADLTFGYEQPGPQKVTVTSRGNVNTVITRAELGQTKVTKDGEEPPAAFILNTTGGTTVNAGQTDNTTYTIQPAAGLGAGTYTADFTVYYNETSASGKVSITVLKADDPAVITDTASVAAGGNRIDLSQNVSGAVGEVSYAFRGDDRGCSLENGVLISGDEGGDVIVEITVGGGDNYKGKTVSVTVTVTPSGEPDPERMQFFRLCKDCELPSTGFSSLRPTVLRDQPKHLRCEPAGMQLMLPTLGEDIELVTVPQEGNSWAVDWLGAAAGILAGSGLPGEGVSVIAAHNTLNDTTFGPFALLAGMEAGDRVFVRTAAGDLLSFEVYANVLVEPDDMAAIEFLAEENALVLITCENEAIGGGYLNRRAVFAK